jgi:Tfp pilus assembly protein PilF
MSLLMQALQKAAKEREGAGRPQSQGGVLALEPIEVEPRVDLAARGSKSVGASAGPTPAQAATVLQATDAVPGWIDWLRDHRKQVCGILIGLAVIGYATYFYLSVYHPAWLRRPIAAPIAAVAPTRAPTPAAPAPLPAKQPEGGAVAATVDPAPVAAATVPVTTPPYRKAVARQAEEQQSAPATSATVRRPVAAAEPAVRQPRDSIAVKPGGEVPRINPQLSEAYDALRSGRIEEAGHLYDAVLKTEPRNVDALLGRAMVAQQQGNPDLATRYLFQVLQVDPSNTLAQGGLINLLGHADPQSAESKLKSLIAKDPSAFLYFTLGNLYADRGNWPAAQTAYFQAHHLARANPDYAFNLAVSLEHLSQPKLALNFYQKALELALVAGRANFDPAAVRDRIVRLAAGVE